MRVRTHTNPLNITHRFDPAALGDIDSTQSLDVEIGFGRGVFLRHWATSYPTHRVVGIEVRRPLVTVLEERVAALALENVTLFHGNGLLFLEDAVPQNTVNRLFVFHPDPWFKKRHHKRRVIHEEAVLLMARCLKQGGRLYISTDVTALFADMCEALGDSGCFRPVEDAFWETEYQSHWDLFSQQEKRSRCYQAFERVSTI